MRCFLHFVFLSLIQFLFFVPTALSWEILTDKLDLKCAQTSKTKLDCDYRLLLPEPPLDIHAGSAGSSLDITGNKSYPWPGGITAILFMVDTSDPGRSDVVEINIDFAILRDLDILFSAARITARRRINLIISRR